MHCTTKSCTMTRSYTMPCTMKSCTMKSCTMRGHRAMMQKRTATATGSPTGARARARIHTHTPAHAQIHAGHVLRASDAAAAPSALLIRDAQRVYDNPELSAVRGSTCACTRRAPAPCDVWMHAHPARARGGGARSRAPRTAPTKQMNMLQALNNALTTALATDDKAGTLIRVHADARWRGAERQRVTRSHARGERRGALGLGSHLWRRRGLWRRVPLHARPPGQVWYGPVREAGRGGPQLTAG